MARAKKKTTSTRAKAPARAAKKTTGKSSTRSTPAKAPKAPKATRAKDETDVQRRWREYWTCRTDLEEAVAAVLAAQAQLAEARALEGSRRSVFEDTKNSLKSLLEVEAPGVSGGSGVAPSPSRPPTPMTNLLNFAGDDDPSAPDEDGDDHDGDDDDDGDDDESSSG